MEQAVKTLNQGQSIAAEGFFNFLFSDEKELIISGPGGVGKTYLLGYLIDTILPRYFKACELTGIPAELQDVVMTATTNKAAEVLSTSTNRPCQTIHSFLNLKVTDDYKTGEQKLEKTRNWRVHQQKILVIDESSMVDRKLLDLVREGTMKCKILYVGDHCQMAPIKETISSIYAQDLGFFELTEPMRNAEQPALQEVCNQLRHTVETGEFLPIPLVPGVIDLLDEAEMQADIDANFVTMDHNDRILAYTNDRVLMYNAYIRQVREMPETFVTGETLVNNTAIRFPDGMLSVEEEVTLLSMTEQSENIEIDHDTFLEVHYCSLQNRFSGLFKDVPIPVDYKHYRDLVQYYRKTKNWERYFYLRNTFPDLRQRDACTVYKAQGSSHDTVYIDLGDISTCRNANQVARMLYVAFSRAKTRIKLFGRLADKYGGLLQ